jgi:hypothetical protein
MIGCGAGPHCTWWVSVVVVAAEESAGDPSAAQREHASRARLPAGYGAVVWRQRGSDRPGRDNSTQSGRPLQVQGGCLGYSTGLNPKETISV